MYAKKEVKTTCNFLYIRHEANAAYCRYKRSLEDKIKMDDEKQVQVAY
jgi:hypothetical protein